MNRDFFDEEYDKVAGEQGSQQGAFDSWSNYNYTQPPVKPTKHRSVRIIFMAIAMVVCFVVGWVLAVVVSSEAQPDERKDILNEVFDTMDYNFYEAVSDEDWQLAVEQAGSVLMQYAGDQYSFLMSPQTYYDFTNGVGNTLTAASNIGELFGISYKMESKGMIISDVAVDSVSYGRFKAGDLIYKMTDIKEYIPITQNGYLQVDENGNLMVERYSDGTPKLTNSPYTTGILLQGADSTQMGTYLTIVYSATFHILRDGEIYQVNVVRNKIGIPHDKKNIDQNKRYDFNFVEYYFSDQVNNISTTPVNGAATCTYEQRCLDKLPKGAGYIRLKQFDEADDVGCDEEIQEALKLFKKNNLEFLVLDLKGNPGGLVRLAVNIAGMFINPTHLSSQELAKLTSNSNLVTNNKTQYLVTSLTDRQLNTSKLTVKSSYYNYFPSTESTNNIKRIVVWTDGNSASASEMLVGVLLDYKTAEHFGTKTYGKGIAQTIEELNITGSYIDVDGKKQNDGKWAVYYTFARYYAPLGKNIHGVGYTPNDKYQADTYTELWDLTSSYWSKFSK